MVSVLAAFVAAAVVVAAEERPDSLAPAAVAFAIFPLVFVLLAVCVCIPFGKVKQIFVMELVDKTRDTDLLMKQRLYGFQSKITNTKDFLRW